jgi:O-antigen/teichoic acid export membrane protein
METKNQAHSVEARVPTQTELALLEYGKQVLIKSSETAIDFHKTMLGVSATFGTLITTVTPILIWGDKDAKIPMPEGWLLILPPLLMLLSAVAFALGYYPRYIQFNPNIVDDVRKVRERIIKSRSLLAGVGLGLFCIALLSLTCLVLWLRIS